MATLGLPPAATSQTCEEIDRAWTWLIEQMEIIQSEKRRQIQRIERKIAELRAGKIDLAESEARRADEDSLTKRHTAGVANINILSEGLSFIAKAKNCAGKMR